MKSIRRRILALAVSVMMLFAMTAGAEEAKVTAVLESPYGNFEGFFAYGFDEDGCEQLIVGLSEIGNLLMQFEGRGVTVGNDEAGYYSMDYEAVVKALNIVMNGIQQELPIDRAIRFTEYDGSEAMARDAQLLTDIAAQEANRFASVALEMGLVTVSENGDLTIEATMQDVSALLKEYAVRLAEDESVIDKVFSLEIIDIMGGNTPEVREQAAYMPYMIMGLAESAAQADAGICLKISASGSVDARAYCTEDGVTRELTAMYDGNGLTVACEVPGRVSFRLNAGVDFLKINVQKTDEENTESFVFEEIAGETYLEYTNEDETWSDVNKIRLNGNRNLMRVYAEFGGYEGFVLSGTLRSKNDFVTFDGDFSKTGSNLKYARPFACEWDIASGVFTAEYESSGTKGYEGYHDEAEYRFEKCETGYKGKMFSKVVDATEEDIVTGMTISAEYDINTEDGTVYAAFETVLDLGNDELDMNVSASVTLRDDKIEIVWSDGEIQNRIYLEIVNGMLVGGMSAAAASDPASVVDYVLITVRIDEETGKGIVTYSNLMTGVSFEAEILAKEGSGTLTTPAGAYELHYECAENEIVFEGSAGAVPFSGKLGVAGEMTGRNSIAMKYYAELTASGETVRAEIPVSINADEQKTEIAGSFHIMNGSETMKLGALTVTHEAADGMFSHVTGMKLSAEEAAQILYMLLHVPY